MVEYIEEVKTDITLTHDGDKLIRRRTIVYKDGEEIGQSNHREVISRDANVPVEVAEMIEARKGKQAETK